jgi:hypothetical protein
MKLAGSNKTPRNWTWHAKPAEGGQAIVFDIDGVLANAAPRQHFITEGNHDWKSFFESCGGDEVIPETVKALELISSDVTRVLLTGRPGVVQEQTVGWLEKKNIPWDLLIMRDRGEYLDSLVFKRQSVRRLKVMGFEVALAFEDDPLNHQMFVEEGVPCMYVHSGYYDMRDAQSDQEKKAN